MYPRSPADLTVPGLSLALGLDPASVSSIETEVVGQGIGIYGQLARIRFVYRAGATGPRSVIAKFPSAIEHIRSLAQQLKFYEREVKFYRHLGKGEFLPSPRCFYEWYDVTSDEFVLLLEDLGDHRLGDQLKGCSAKDAFVAVHQLADLHAEWWESPKLKTIDWVPLGESEANKGAMALYPVAWPLFLQRCGAALSDEMLRIGERLSDQIAAMLDRFRDRPRTLCHGDYRLDNLFFGMRSDQEPIRVVDWQIVSQCVGTYDVGMFLGQSVAPSIRREIELDLLRSYHDRLLELGVRNYTFADCIDDYRWTLMFCFCYPVIGGGLGDVANERGVALAQAMTDRCVLAIRDWKAFEFLKP